MKTEAPNKSKNPVNSAASPNDALQDKNNVNQRTNTCKPSARESVKHWMSTTLHEKPRSEFDIVQLIYCSHAADCGNKAEFDRNLFDILDHSHANNPLHDITSALMTDGSMFAHVVEGPSVAVKELYAKIMRDKRHSRVLTLQHVLVHVRLFALWPAAFLRVGAMPHARMLDAQSTPPELRKVSVSVLKAFRPILLQ